MRRGAIVLAAGRSRRMGTCKVLLPVGGTTVLGRILGELSRCSLDETVVVVGRGAESVEAAVRRLGVSVTTNPDPGADMLSSVRCGLQAVSESCRALLIALGDQPRLRAETVDALFGAHAGEERRIAVPVHGGRRGHPIVVSSSYRAEILTRYDDTGLRGLLREHAGEVVGVETEDPSVLLDMDTPEDYARERRALERGDTGGDESR